ncbi:hypothetical protein [Lentzea sp. NBRC 102530]|uniref:hypothetical protein n=1 Tax=Lentzea sp. NBRC 102530 TaxID=3032201 RepID=UPI0024A269BF|nr:hypothetical protein [Lentzea sp. NBRC 102530]GLY54781.1 hypothetical protein Lesp01_84360 [Lentzea sp. NBRC 102530]
MRSVVLLVTVLLSAASAAPGQLAADDHRQLAALTRAYLERRADKITVLPPAPGFGVPTTEAFAARLRTDEARLAARRARLDALPFGGYARAEVGAELTRVAVGGDGSAVVHVQEVTHLYFEEPGGVPRSSFGFGHVLVFERAPEGWLLADAMPTPGSVCKVPPETQFCGSER